MLTQSVALCSSNIAFSDILKKAMNFYIHEFFDLDKFILSVLDSLAFSFLFVLQEDLARILCNSVLTEISI